MKVYNRLQDVPSLQNVVMTIGTFDGVHLGHKKLLSRIIDQAKEINGQSVLLTFHPHPRMVLQPDKSKGIHLLTTIEERIHLLAESGLDHVVIVPFSVDFANMPAKKYVETVLINHFHPTKLIIGYDHKFGKNREGDFNLLKDLQTTFHYQVEQITKQTLDDNTFSSTNIRKALLQGNILTTNKLLGYRYSITGVVTKGNQIGRTIGFPTANIELVNEDKLIPANGVYVVKATVDGHNHFGMLNIGTRPTFQGKEKTIEAHLFSFNQNIYGLEMNIEFIDFLRDEENFSSANELINQLKKDHLNALKIVNDLK